MFFDEFDKILRRIAGQCRFTEMQILGNKILGPCVNVCKITPTAAGDDDFAPDFGVMLDDQDSFVPFARLDSAKQPRRSTADDDGVINHFLNGYSNLLQPSPFADMPQCRLRSIS